MDHARPRAGRERGGDSRSDQRLGARRRVGPRRRLGQPRTPRRPGGAVGPCGFSLRELAARLRARRGGRRGRLARAAGSADRGRGRGRLRRPRGRGASAARRGRALRAPRLGAPALDRREAGHLLAQLHHPGSASRAGAGRLRLRADGQGRHGRRPVGRAARGRPLGLVRAAGQPAALQAPQALRDLRQGQNGGRLRRARAPERGGAAGARGGRERDPG